jgi:glutaminyl-peptide cyclotransferase
VLFTKEGNYYVPFNFNKDINGFILRKQSLNMKLLLTAFLITSLLCGCGCGNHDKHNNINFADTTSLSSVKQIDYSVIKSYPHDVTSFTEGFLFHDGQLYESTGSPENLLYARSVFGPVDLKTGKIDIKGELDRKIYFGEGIVFFKNKLYELTYKNQKGFIYDAKTFKKLGQFSYDNKEGWSLTTDGTYIIMDDGTDKLTYVDENFKVVKTLAVTENGTPVDNLNELEYIKGFIYANIWMKNYIVKIDTATGKIVGKIDLSMLFDEAKAINPEIDVTNGIAYDSIDDKIYVTGKLWANIYQIEFNH